MLIVLDGQLVTDPDRRNRRPSDGRHTLVRGSNHIRKGFQEIDRKKQVSQVLPLQQPDPEL